LSSFRLYYTELKRKLQYHLTKKQKKTGSFFKNEHKQPKISENGQKNAAIRKPRDFFNETIEI